MARPTTYPPLSGKALVLILVSIVFIVGLAPARQAAAAACVARSGWKWTDQPALFGIEAQVQRELKRSGVDALAQASSHGETDACGTFYVASTDITIISKPSNPIATLKQQEISRAIHLLLTGDQKAKLGAVQISFLPNQHAAQAPSAVAAASTGWQKLATASAPDGRYTHGLAYDSERKVAVLFGGDNTGSARLNDTWEYDESTWHKISTSQSPPGRVNIDQTLVYDAKRKKTVLFGGLGSGGYLNDTWEYNGTTWAQIGTALAPAQRDSHAMVFDSQRGVEVLFGGYHSSGARLSDTWEYNGGWKQVSTPQAPSGRSQHAMAYDQRRHVVVLFGGSASNGSFLGDTWEYDGSTWQHVAPAQSPPARTNHSMAYDAARGVVVLFAGENAGGVLNDTWEYDGTTWRQINSGQPPAARKEMSLVFDQQRASTLFFGGGYWSGSLIAFKETWSYIGPPLTSGNSIKRKVYVIVYDPLLSNGQNLSTYLGWSHHADLTQGTIDFFKSASNGQLQYTVVYTTVVTDGWPEKTDGFRYSESEYLATIHGQSTWHVPDAVNYTKIVNSPQFDMCGKVNRGEIDEVWIYNGPGFGFYESTLVGPNAYFYNSPPVPGPTNCNRLLPIMGPSPERALPEAIHNFGHRTESTMAEVYGGWQENSTSHSWDKFALVKSLSPDYSYSGCGNTHFPPNGVQDYDYTNSSSTPSNCDDFANYPNLNNPASVAQPVSCSSWECIELHYYAYWFGHLPSKAGCGPDQVANDWWRYIAEPALALDPPAACQAPRSFVYLPLTRS